MGPPIPDVRYAQDAGASRGLAGGGHRLTDRQSGGLSPGAVVCLTTLAGGTGFLTAITDPDSPQFATSAGAARLPDQDLGDGVSF